MQDLRPDRHGSVNGASSRRGKGLWLEPLSGHVPGLWARSLARTCVRGSRSMFLSHVDVSLLSLLFLSFPLSKNKQTKRPNHNWPILWWSCSSLFGSQVRRFRLGGAGKNTGQERVQRREWRGESRAPAAPRRCTPSGASSPRLVLSLAPGNMPLAYFWFEAAGKDIFCSESVLSFWRSSFVRVICCHPSGFQLSVIRLLKYVCVFKWFRK